MSKKEKTKRVTFSVDGMKYIMKNLKGRSPREYLQAAIDALPSNIDPFIRDDLQSIYDKNLISSDYKTDMLANGFDFRIEDEIEEQIDMDF